MTVMPLMNPNGDANVITLQLLAIKKKCLRRLDFDRLDTALCPHFVRPDFPLTLNGCDALILLNYNRPVIVKGYDPSLGTKTYTTVSGVLAYDDPVTGKVYHLVINQAIHIPHLDHHLLCPMQC